MLLLHKRVRDEKRLTNSEGADTLILKSCETWDGGNIVIGRRLHNDQFKE